MSRFPKRVAIVGYGIEGRSAQAYFAGRGAETTVFHDHTQFDHRVAQAFDLVVRSPGVDPRLLAGVSNLSSCTEYFFDHCPAPIVGVTGTHSDAAVRCVADIMRAAGLRCWESGNVAGVAISRLDHIQPTDVAVLGLSSFQLHTLRTSPGTALVLSLEGASLKYHPDLHEYLDAKTNLVRYQKPTDTVCFWSDGANSRAVAAVSPGIRRGFDNRSAAVTNTDPRPEAWRPLSATVTAGAVEVAGAFLGDPGRMADALTALGSPPSHAVDSVEVT